MVRILSIDGGGMRGVVPATVMVYFEKQLKKITGDNTTRIADYFDMVAGTSTGGILTCFYLSHGLQYTAKKALGFYVDKGNAIFNQSKNKGYFGLRQLFNATKYDPTTLETIFKRVFGNTSIDDLTKPCVVTAYDLKTKSPVFFKSHKQKDTLVRDVARSTSAAPTYFPPNQHNGMACVDGGLFANNPTMCAYSEVLKQFNNPKTEDIYVLSLGSGGGRFHLPNLFKKWSVIDWAKAVPEICMDGALDTVDHQMRHIFASNKENYLRINVPNELRNYSKNMADASPKNIELLKRAGEGTLKKYKKQIDSFIEMLVE